MKLETEFVRLPLAFDVERLKEEAGQFSENDWMSHTTGFAGNSSIPLISLYGEVNDAMHGPMMPAPALERCEYIRQVMAAFGEVFSRSRLMRLDPRSEVPPHVDVNFHWFNRVRVHIPITTNPDVSFHCGDKHVHMGAGEAWIFNSWAEHTVKNNGDETRVHLVLDTTGSTRFWEMVDRGDWPFDARRRSTFRQTYVPFEPGKHVDIRTESYNTPLVQSAAELEILIGALLDDIRCSGTEEVAGRERFARIARDFVRSWREVWSEHGMKPGGWPYYHGLVSQADEAIRTLTPELNLASGIDAVQAFRSLVLSSAINEEFAPQYLDKDEIPEQLEKTARQFSVSPDSSRSPENPGGDVEKVARNALCPCGSGERYKRCHGRLSGT